MAEHVLYIDCDRAKSVQGSANSGEKPLLKFVQGDTPHLKIYLLQGYDRIAAYTPIPTVGITLEVALGIRIGNDSEIYAAQYTWTPSADLSDPYFEATAADSALAYFEVKYFRDAVPTTVLSEQVKIWAAVIKADSVVPVAEPTPLSAEVANATYLARTVQGVIRLVSEDGLKQADLYLSNDGTFHVDPVT